MVQSRTGGVEVAEREVVAMTLTRTLALAAIVGAGGTWSYYSGKHAADRWYARYPTIKTVEISAAVKPPVPVEADVTERPIEWERMSGGIGQALWTGEGWVCWPFGASCSVNGDEVKYNIPPPIGAYACIDLSTEKTHRCTKKDIPKDYLRAVQR